MTRLHVETRPMRVLTLAELRSMFGQSSTRPEPLEAGKVELRRCADDPAAPGAWMSDEDVAGSLDPHEGRL
jgi:hypothetical protein